MYVCLCVCVYMLYACMYAFNLFMYLNINIYIVPLFVLKAV